MSGRGGGTPGCVMPVPQAEFLDNEVINLSMVPAHFGAMRPSLPLRRFTIEDTGTVAIALMLAIGVLILLLLRGAQGVDRIARASEETLLRNGLAARTVELQAAVVPQANWDDTVTNLDVQFDPDWASANIGVFLTQTSGFELVSVLDKNQQTVFATSEGKPASRTVVQQLEAQTRSLVADIRRRETGRGPFQLKPGNAAMISSPIQATAISNVAGTPYVLVATLVQPDFGTALPSDRAPIIVTAEAINPAFLALLVARYQLEGARIVATSTPKNGTEAALEIDGADGTPLLSLRWQPHQPATSFLRATWYYIALSLLMCIGGVLYFSLAARRARSSLRVALAAAQNASEAKSDFLASMSHEIRTPLNGVLGSLHLLETEDLSPEGRRMLQTAAASGEMVNALINDVLDFSKIEAGKLVLEPISTDVARLLGLVIETFNGQCRQKNLEFVPEIEESLEWAMLDPLRLKQCLFNLLGNAVKFTNEGRIVFRVQSAERDQLRVLRFEVSDTGIGVCEAAQAELFQRFKQADSSMTRNYGGTGLGLAITRELAGLMGGSVRMSSEERKGSTFYLEVLAPVADPQSSQAAAVDESGPLEGLSMLVVDDNATNLMIASTLLRRMGAEITTAESGQEAISVAVDRPFDLILMDIQMPGMDGLETTRRLRQLVEQVGPVPVIALTANVMESHREEYLAAGMDGVVGKPIAPAILLREVLRLASRQQTLAA